MREIIRTLLAVVGCLLIVFIANGIHNPKYTNATVDVSWPNCSPKTTEVFPSGIVGITGGLDFAPNPCLAQETTWFSHYDLYMNTGYPGRFYGIKYDHYPKHCSRNAYSCLGYNFGYNAAEYAIDYSYAEVAHSSVWWIDVETENSWTLHPAINRSVLEGALTAVKQVPFVSQIGIYSAPGQWNYLTNNWRIKLPAWIGIGTTAKKSALDACSEKSFTGGPIILSQYINKFDIDVPCI